MKLNKILGTSFMLAGLYGASVGAAYAADVKIGVLDVQQIMQKSPEVQQLNAKLQNKFKPRQEKLMSAKNSIQAEMADYTKNQAVMKADEQAKLKNKIIADQRAYQTDVQAFQKDLSQEQSKDMQEFMNHLQTVVNNVAKQNQYNFILNRAAVPYMEPSDDVTQKVLDLMGKK